MDEHLFLAKILSEIHSYSLYPYYSKKPSKFWEELEITTDNNNEVDKEFFIKMANDIIAQIEAKLKK